MRIIEMFSIEEANTCPPKRIASTRNSCALLPAKRTYSRREALVRSGLTNAAKAVAADPGLTDPDRKNDLLRASGFDGEAMPGPDLKGMPQQFLVHGDEDEWDNLELALRARIRESRGS
jgi:hypothetical protein